MSFLTKVYRQIKLTAAGIPDLDLELFKHAGSFEHAVALLIDQLEDDLYRLASKTEVAAATILEFERKEDRVKKILDANAFANRVDAILAYRCKQYVTIADLYKVTMLKEEDRKQRENKALLYLKKIKNTLDLINRLASISLNTIQRESNAKLYGYIERISTLTWQEMKEMLQRGEVPFRLK